MSRSVSRSMFLFVCMSVSMSVSVAISIFTFVFMCTEAERGDVGKWEKCWNELESIECPDEEWSQGEAATPSRTPSPETIISDKMMGGKLWMKVGKLARFLFYNTYVYMKWGASIGT